LTDLFNLYLYK